MSDSKPDSQSPPTADSTAEQKAGETHGYQLTCPEGHAYVDERPAKDWHTALADRNLLVYCAECDRHWQPSPELTTRMMEWARTLLPG